MFSFHRKGIVRRGVAGSIGFAMMLAVSGCAPSSVKTPVSLSLPKISKSASAPTKQRKKRQVRRHRPNDNIFAALSRKLKQNKAESASSTPQDKIDFDLRTASVKPVISPPTQAALKIPKDAILKSTAENTNPDALLRKEPVFAKKNRYNDLLLPPDRLPRPDHAELTVAYHGNNNLPETGSLALGKIITGTLQSSPDVGVALARERDAYYGVKQSKSSFKPKVNFEATSGPESSRSQLAGESQGLRNEVNLTVDQTIYDFGVSHGDLKRRKLLYKSAYYRRVSESETVAFDVVRAAYNVLSQRELQVAASRNVKAHQRIARLVKISEQEGNSTVADVKRVTTRLDAARNVLIDVESALQSANNAFQRITDIDPTRLTRPKTLNAPTDSLKENDIETLITKNPELIGFYADQESLIAQTKQQFGNYFPELFAQIEARYRQDIGGDILPNQTVRGLVGLRFNLYDGGEKKAVLEQIRSRVDESIFAYRRLYRELVEEMRDNFQTLRSSQKKVGILSDARASARKVVELYADQFKLGSRTLFELLDAQTDLYNTERDLITNRYDAALATYSNLRLRGELLPHIEKLQK